MGFDPMTRPDAPDRRGAHAGGLHHWGATPGGLSGGFGLHGHAHDLALFGPCDRLDPTRAALVFLNACRAMLGETLVPPSHLGLVLPEFRSDLLIGFAFAG